MTSHGNINKFVEDIKNGVGASSMSKEATEVFTMAMIGEFKGKRRMVEDLSESDCTFLMNVIQKRIDIMKIPIKFSVSAMIACEALSEGVVGKMVIILVDCLNEYEGQEITVDKVANLYPFGFYNEEVFTDYVDNYLKPRKVNWAHTY